MAAPEPFIASTRFENNPRFSPDGKRLAFCSDRTSDVIEIFVSDADGSRPLQLTRGVGLEQGAPMWSPDGRRIAFDSWSEAGDWSIYVIDAAGGIPRLLTPGPADEHLPSWSRDGQWIYFASNRSGRFEIWRAPAEGGDAVRVTSAGGFSALESWDGQRLYYLKSQTVSFQPLFDRSLAGGEERQILDAVGTLRFAVVEQGLYHLAPRPDSQRGAVIRYLDFGTGRTRDLARFDELVQLGLSVSPDRKTILFTGYKPINHDLVLIENFR